MAVGGAITRLRRTTSSDSDDRQQGGVPGVVIPDLAVVDASCDGEALRPSRVWLEQHSGASGGILGRRAPGRDIAI